MASRAAVLGAQEGKAAAEMGRVVERRVDIRHRTRAASGVTLNTLNALGVTMGGGTRCTAMVQRVDPKVLKAWRVWVVRRTKELRSHYREDGKGMGSPDPPQSRGRGEQ